jgi:hypothetical protein
MTEIEQILKKLRDERDDINRKIEALMLARGLLAPKPRNRRTGRRGTLVDTLAFAKTKKLVTIDNIATRFKITRPAATQRLVALTKQKQMKRVSAGRYEVVRGY